MWLCKERWVRKCWQKNKNENGWEKKRKEKREKKLEVTREIERKDKK